MKHPTSEEWMDFLYDELDPLRQAELKDHLGRCPDCTTQLASWRHGMTALDQWQLAPLRPHAGGRSFFRWAAAAALVVGLGFGFSFGRWSAPNRAEMQAWQKSVEANLQRELATAKAELSTHFVANAVNASTLATEQWFEDYARAQDEKRQEDLQSIATAVESLDSRQRADYAFLRRALETMAVATKDSLVELAGITTMGLQER